MNNKDLSGMSVNERLYELGLMKKFDRAILFRRKKTAKEILIQAQLSEEQANETINAIYKSPRKYGYLF